VTVLDACCGAVEGRCGAPGAEARARETLAYLRGRGAFQVVTSDPRCYAHLKTQALYRRELQVYHLNELYRDHLSPCPAGPTVGWHEPLELEPFPGQAEVARDVIRRAGGKVAEVRPRRVEARCAGTEGATATFVPELGAELGRARLQDFAEADVTTIVTSDALVRAHLRAIAEQAGNGADGGKGKVEVVTLAEWLLARLAEAKRGA
jgi:Fe-S oxidoreductase